MNQPVVDLRAIRSIGGSKARAFEELSYQLLTSGIDRDRFVLIRTGNPDAGAEWYTTDRETGHQEVWQAKYIFEIEPLLSGMTESVKAVCKKRPEAKRMTFVIPWNLPDGRQSGSKSAREKFGAKITAWKKQIAGASDLEFELVDESELLKALSHQRHVGVLRFFFDHQSLSIEQLRDQYKDARAAAGGRYRPELQVDIPIQELLESAAKRGHFSGKVDAEIVRLRMDWEEARPLQGLLAAPSLLVLGSVKGVLDSADSWSSDSVALPARLSALTDALAKAAGAIDALEGAADDADDEIAETSTETDRASRRSARPLSYREETSALRRLSEPIRNLRRHLGSPEANLFSGRALFMTGDAGAGKTHLLLDACGRALDNERPFVVLFGDQFGPGPLWPQLASQLGLPPGIAKAELLGAIEACGAAADDSRFVIAVDALNETTDSSFWPRVLPELASAIARCDHVSLVVTVRSTFVDIVDPEGRRRSDFVLSTHHGLSGRESEATRLYFTHYGMEAPRYPLLSPEFTNPLFLQLYCETHQDDGHPPQGASSRVHVFERLVSHSLDQVARALASSATPVSQAIARSDAQSVLDALLDAMAVAGGEALPLDEALSVANAAPHNELEGAKVLAQLEASGLLAAAPIRFDSELRLGIRATFQALADYLLLRRRWEAAGLTDCPDHAFVEWLAEASWGVQEAAAVWMPELTGVELRNVVRPAETDGYEAKRLDALTLRTLVYRSTDSISDHTIEVVNRCLQSDLVGATEVFSQLAAVAAIPGHPLNADLVHAYLEGLKLADRDALFGVAAYDALATDGPYRRLAEWARNGPYPTYDPSVVELAAVPLVWLLSSPNRPMRDWITKVLVQLLGAHPTITAALVDRFRKTDDIYVRERLAAIAYGSLMRSDSTCAADDYRLLVETVIETYLRDPVPNALLLDHVEGIVELAAARGLLDAAALDVTHRPPFGFKVPHHPWTMKYIEERYGYHRNGSADYDFAYSGIYGSLFSMGDFGRYRVDSSVERFSNAPLDGDPPKSERPERVLDEHAYNGILDSADPDVLGGLLEKLSQQADDASSGPPALTSSEQELAYKLSDCWSWTRPEPSEYSTDRARRWVFMRAIQLGWTPERFGHFESWRNRDNGGRDASKPERFGKKYQWIGYFELLAKLRDNFHLRPSYFVTEEDSGGLWESHDRDIDPSTPPVASFDELARGASDVDSTWKGPTVEVSLPAFERDWLTHYLNHPTIDPLTEYEHYPTGEDFLQAVATDPTEWIVLDAHYSERIDDRSMRFGMALDQATIHRSWIAPIESVASCTRAVVELGHGVRTPHGSALDDSGGHTSCCYVGELGWRDQGCYHRRVAPVSNVTNEAESSLVSTVEDYLWESGGYDCSIAASTRITAPSAALLQRSDLRWSGDLTWLDSDGEVAAADLGQLDGFGNRALVVRRGWLQSWLKETKQGLVVRTWTERRDFRDEEQPPFHELASVVGLDQDLHVVVSDTSSGAF